MHELSLCQSLLEQIEQQARTYPDCEVSAVWLQIGPLAGVEPDLLRHAYSIAAVGSVAERAVLYWETIPIQVRCQACGAVSTAEINRLRCGACGDYHTTVLTGDELILARLELNPRLFKPVVA